MTRDTLSDMVRTMQCGVAMRPLTSLGLASLALVTLISFGCSSSEDATPPSDDVGHDEDDHGNVGDQPGTVPSDETSDASAPEEPGSTPDAGRDGGAPTCALVQPTHIAQLEYGLHPTASDGLRFAGIGVSGISQTIGNAAASAGTHAKDGTFMGLAYSAATDIRLLGRSEAQIAALLDKLASVGFAAWYRKPGFDGWPATEAPHIHAVFVGAPMKLILRNQVRDWMAGKNGLASHTTYRFHTWTKCSKDPVWAEFLKHNPATN